MLNERNTCGISAHRQLPVKPNNSCFPIFFTFQSQHCNIFPAVFPEACIDFPQALA